MKAGILNVKRVSGVSEYVSSGDPLKALMTTSVLWEQSRIEREDGVSTPRWEAGSGNLSPQYQ